jgi:hypothetical protein
VSIALGTIICSRCNSELNSLTRCTELNVPTQDNCPCRACTTPVSLLLY